MTFERTRDYSLIREIMTHSRVYPYITDDYAMSPNEFQPIQSDLLWYVLVKDGEDVLGLWLFVPHNAVCWEIHTCLLPKAYGQRARLAARELAGWIWANTTCLRVITNIPVYNRHALKFAEDAGLKQFGVNEKSYMKSGLLHDQIMLGVSKPCQQPSQSR